MTSRVGKGEVSDAHRSGNRVVLDLSGHADLHCGIERHLVDAYRQPRVAAPLSEDGPISSEAPLSTCGWPRKLGAVHVAVHLHDLSDAIEIAGGSLEL